MKQDPKKDTPQRRGGLARREALSPEERRAAARRAALARWGDSGEMPEASHAGQLPIGDVVLDAYVLEDGRRLLHKRGMARGLGLKSDGGNAFMKTISRPAIGSRISEELWRKIENPIVFKPLGGDPAHGYEGTILIEVCDAIIQARNEGALRPSQLFLAAQAEMIVRSAAKIGIMALIDEATGYSDNKRKTEYRELFQQFLLDEVAQWHDEYPDKFFDMIYKLYGLKRKNPDSNKHPQFFGKFIRKYIYYPLANSHGAILEHLDQKNPVVYLNGGRKYKMYQFLTEKVGLPALRAHLWQTIGIGAVVSDYIAFDRAFYKAFPEAIPNRRDDGQLRLEGF